MTDGGERTREPELEPASADQPTTERRLSEAVALLSATLEATADGILVVDRAGRMLSHNRRFVELWRLPGYVMADYRDEVALEAAKDQLLDPEGFLRKVRSVYEAPDVDSFDTLSFKDGRVLERHSRPLRVGEQVAGRVWSFRDVTARIAAERALQASEERSRRLYDEAPIAIQELNRDGNLQEVNRAWLALLGRDRDEVIGRSFLDFLAPESKHHFAEIFECFKQEGEVENEELELERKDGSRVSVLFEGRITRLGGDAALLTRCILQDISERKAAERRMLQQNAFLRTVVDSIPHPFFVVDSANHAIVMANAFTSTLGESAGSTCHALTHKRATPCLGAGEVCPLEVVRATKKPVVVEHVHYDPRGRPRYVEVHGYPVLDGRGEVVQMIEYSLDITPRKELEMERTELITSLQESLARVNVLSGLLPICAACKKIRDDQGYWTQIEAYIRDHSDAQFTHGMCPECTKEWFSDTKPEKDPNAATEPDR